MHDGSFAKTVIASSILTTVILLSGLYLVKDAVFDMLASSQEVVTAIQEHTIIVQENEQLADMVEQTNVAVVSILATKDVPVYERVYDGFDPFGGFFGGGFGVPQVREQGTEEREVGGGSGFIVSPEGMIVTNRHVVSDTDARYSVMLVDGNSYPVRVLARDEVLDIAILQIEDEGNRSFSYLPFGDSDSLRLGQTVIAIGNALAEFDNSVSVGVVSGLSRSIAARNQRGMVEQLDQVIQTDAAINLGNSGGPLLNIAGEVIGVNVAASLQAQNIGFAIPINTVAQVVSSVQETGEIVRPFLGVRHANVTQRMAELNSLPISYGVLILRGETRDELAVMPGSPAAQAGLREGDIILAIDGRELRGVSLAHVLRNKRVGQTISMQVWRDGEELTLEATLTAAP